MYHFSLKLGRPSKSSCIPHFIDSKAFEKLQTRLLKLVENRLLPEIADMVTLRLIHLCRRKHLLQMQTKAQHVRSIKLKETEGSADGYVVLSEAKRLPCTVVNVGVLQTHSSFVHLLRGRFKIQVINVIFLSYNRSCGG